MTHVLELDRMTVRAGKGAKQYFAWDRPPGLSNRHDRLGGLSYVSRSQSLSFGTSTSKLVTGRAILKRCLMDCFAPVSRWALLGPNGSGKTTLLSLIAADHPQAYSNDVYLFGEKRGSGETIWEIKKHIGLVSPEMHLPTFPNRSPRRFAPPPQVFLTC